MKPMPPVMQERQSKMRQARASSQPRRRFTASAGPTGRPLAGLAALALCLALFSAPSLAAEDDDDDPLRSINRPIHSFNLNADRFLLRPATSVYRRLTPRAVRDGASRFLDNLKLPMVAVNHILQGDVEAAGKSVLRFATNTTLGLAGVMDVASEMGLEYQPTDLGLTLSSWGVGTGPYFVLPLLGPSTIRDAPAVFTQRAVDPVQDLDFARGESGLALGVFQVIDARARNYRLVNDVLYDSVDSYAAVKGAYLQRRRRQGGEVDDQKRIDQLPDLFEDEELWEDEPWDEEQTEEPGAEDGAGVEE